MHCAILLGRMGLALAVVTAACDTCPDTAPDNGGVLLAPEGNCSQGFSKFRSSTFFEHQFQAWSPGKNIDMKNPYGSVRIQVGGIEYGARVSAFVEPFTYALWESDANRRLKANEATFPDFHFFNVDKQGNLVLDVTTNGEIQYDLTADIPKIFDGVLTVTADRDDIDYWLWNSSQVSGAKFLSGSGNITANFSNAANFTIQAKAEHGIVSFGSAIQGRNAFKDVVISPDGTSGTAVVGNGAGSLEASTSHGNIAFNLIR